VVGWTSVGAARIVYAFPVHDGQDVRHEIPLEVAHGGKLRIRAEWSGNRILTIRLDGPDGSRVRRGGPSPLEIDVPAGPSSDGSPQRYVVNILGLPASGGDSGTLTVRLPDSPEVVKAREEAMRPPPPPPPRPKPWMIAVDAPEHSGPDRVDLYRAVERLRDRLVDEKEWTVGIDTCRWQEAALTYFAEQRDSIGSGGMVPSIATRRYFREVADAIVAVEAFRTSGDPIVAGPIPEDPRRRRLWLRAREQRVEPLERQLDRLLEMLQDGFVPELEDHEWPLRLISCLTACQRHFDETMLEGRENAGNARLAASQWERILAAAAAFESMGTLSGDDTAQSRRAGVPPR
jgi:hypothetical protein